MTDTPLLGLALDAGSIKPMFEQIAAALRRRIVAGRLPAGARLPPSRSLAEELGVSRATVVAAYDQLVAEGFAAGRRGAGTFVGDIGAIEAAPAMVRRPPAPPPAPAPAPVPFQPGIPDMRLFPYRPWARCVARVARTAPEAMVRGTDPFGDLRLRAAVARYLADWRALGAAPENILITAGVADALETCARAITRRGDAIALEDPGYPRLRSLSESLGLKPVWLDVDSDGARPPSPGDGPAPRLALLTPSWQFPLGGAMPSGRRMAFLRWAERAGAWIVEDDFDSEFRYAGRPIPALAGLDGGGRTIYVGSFSKVFSDSLRIGFMVVPAPLRARVADTVARFGTKASLAPQRPLATFLESGEFYTHLRRVRRLYAERRRAFLALLRAELGHVVAVDAHPAGMQVAVRLPPACDDAAIAARAAAAGIACSALSAHAARQPAPRGLLMGFCAFTAEEMAAAMVRLRRIVDAALSGSDGAAPGPGR